MPRHLRRATRPGSAAAVAAPAAALLVALAVAAVGLSGCRSQKLPGERKPLGKAYHNFTAHYNGYFNANELILLAEEELAAGQQRDFDQILPVYPAYAVADASASNAGLDKAMEKVSVVVNVHQPSSYDDDSYLLLGRAQLLKRDYEDAEHTLEFALKEFDPANERARLKRLAKKRAERDKELAREARERARRAGAPPPRSAAPKKKKRRKSAPPKRRKSAAKKSPAKKRTARADAGADKSGEPSRGADAKKGRKAAPQKKKSRAEMAREQREARLAAEKDAAREAERAEREAEKEAARQAREAEDAAAAAAREPRAKPAVPDAADALDDGEGLVAATTSEERPKRGPFVHETALQDISYWLARTYVAREKYVDAERVLGKLARSGATFKHVRRDLPAAYADLYLRRGDLESAVPYLEDAIALTKRRADRARYAFILGQVRQRLGDRRGAYAEYRRALKLKPDFEMQFFAELALATSAAEGGASTDEAIKQLRRMAREEKYAEYRDRVYAEMASVALADGRREEGIGYLREALKANTGDRRYAAKAYLQLGDLYFEGEEYVLANNYYDSTLQVLPKEDPRYPQVEAYRNSLGPIAANLTLIAEQDSLLALAALPVEEQRARAAELERARREEARQRAIEASRAAAENPGRPAGGAARGRRAAGQPVSTFFAYDDKAVRRGTRAFERRWGDRPLGDNWRTRDEREAQANLEQEFAAAEETPDVTDEEIDRILEGVPATAEARLAAERKIETALLALGRQYRDKLENPARAAEALEELLRRFPQTADAPEALYLLALAYDDLGRVAEARSTRERLMRDYPESKYARSLADPAFLANAKDAERKLVSFYETTYELYESGDTPGARERLGKVDAEFGPDNELQPRFALLNAMVAGREEGRDSYVEELKKVTSKYPDSEEATRAREILRLLGERSAAVAGLDQAARGDAPTDNFKLEADKPHYFLAVMPKGASMSEAKAKAADYNGENHRLRKLSPSSVFMMNAGEQTPVLVVRRFQTQDEAMDYYVDVTGNAESFLGGVEFEPLVISQTNYREVLRSKNLAGYLSFFSANYL